jgi:hypothetical protein
MIRFLSSFFPQTHANNLHFSAHTQATAYLVGLIAGDKLVAEHGLDE